MVNNYSSSISPTVKLLVGLGFAFVGYEVYSSFTSKPAVTNIAAGAAAAKLNNPGVAVGSLLTSDVLTSVIATLQTAYTPVIHPTFGTTADIIQPLITASYSVNSQSQWAQICAAYTASTQTDLYTAVSDALTASWAAGIFSIDTTGIDAVKAYILTLPA